jgi:hypothetical protein
VVTCTARPELCAFFCQHCVACAEQRSVAGKRPGRGTWWGWSRHATVPPSLDASGDLLCSAVIWACLPVTRWAVLFSCRRPAGSFGHGLHCNLSLLAAQTSQRTRAPPAHLTTRPFFETFNNKALEKKKERAGLPSHTGNANLNRMNFRGA